MKEDEGKVDIVNEMIDGLAIAIIFGIMLFVIFI